MLHSGPTMNITMRLLPLVVAAAMQQGPVKPGWTELFNGKDLTGWQAPTQAPPPAAPAPGGRGQGAQAPAFTSPEILPDKRIAFRLYAPDATTVTLRGGDIPAPARANAQFTKGANGVWEMTTGAVEPGAYRYVYVVNGVGVIDPRNTAISESNTTTWSVAVVPGSDLMDTKTVPHGAVATVYYQSTALGRTRRMHVYTPPGYESGKDKYPVFYLLHGAGDCDDSWTSVGRANFILDNLIAASKAKPMIVVMPAGHTNAGGGGRGAAPRAALLRATSSSRTSSRT